MELLIPILLFVVMYMLLIRPQKRRMQEREAMVRSADVGDEVATVGGVIGLIVAEEGSDVVVIEVDDDVELRVQRRAIGELLTKAGGSSLDDGEEILELDEAADHDGPISDA